MIEIENIKLQGFGSFIQPESFKLNREGLTIIRGRVGSGKTTIPSALVWCFFGITLKSKSSIETWEHLQSSNYQGTKVESTFTKKKKYKIIRCLNYQKKVGKIKGGNNLFIYEDGELIHHKRNKPDKQKFINDLLGYSFSLFINSIVFGQRMKKIIEETGPIKKKIFEEAFEITFIEEARKTTKSKLEQTNRLISEGDLVLENIDEKIRDAKEDYKDTLQDEKEFKKNKRIKIKKVKLQLRETQAKKLELGTKLFEIYNIKRLKKKNRRLNIRVKGIKKHNCKIEDLVTYIEKIEAEETKLHNEPDGDIKICPVCGGKLSFNMSKKLTKQRKTRLKELGIEADNKREELMSMSKLKKGKFEKLIEVNINKINNTKINKALKMVNDQQVKEVKIRLNEIKQDLKDVKDETLIIRSHKYLKKITKLEKKHYIKSEEVTTLKGKRGIDEWLVKDPLSNTGLKAYIFDSLLSKVNDYLLDYSRILGFRVEFGIDLESTRKDFYQTVTRNGNLIMYEDLSGGQKQLVDTSVALAIHSVISSIRPMNIIFMDEPFEGLDEETIETVAELISYKCKDQCLYLITHHTSFNPINATEILMKLNPEGHTIVL